MLNSFLEKKSKENLDVLTGEIGQKFSRPTWGLVSSSTEKKMYWWGIPGIGLAGVNDFLSIFLLYYYNQVLGLSAALAGLACLSQWSLTQFQIPSLRIGPTGITGSMVVAFRL